MLLVGMTKTVMTRVVMLIVVPWLMIMRTRIKTNSCTVHLVLTITANIVVIAPTETTTAAATTTTTTTIFVFIIIARITQKTILNPKPLNPKLRRLLAVVAEDLVGSAWAGLGIRAWGSGFRAIKVPSDRGR